MARASVNVRVVFFVYICTYYLEFVIKNIVQITVLHGKINRKQWRRYFERIAE